MRPLILLCLGLLGSPAHAQLALGPSALDPVDSDFCKGCRRMTSASFAGIGTVTVYAEEHPVPRGGTTYWLVIATKTQVVAGAVFELVAGPCGAGHCHFVDSVSPTLRSFSYRVDKHQVMDVGLELEIDRTDEVLEATPRARTHWKQRLFAACGTTETGAWTCRNMESRCERATWARTAEPAVQSTCTEQLGRTVNSP